MTSRSEHTNPSQNEVIREHLESGRPIDAMTALKRYGCFRLAARIQNLRDEGLQVRTELVREDGRRYARYHLVQ